MSVLHKNMLNFYGTLELNFFLHFCVISTIINIVNRNPFMILFAPLCIIYTPLMRATSFPLVALYVISLYFLIKPVPK